MFWNRKKQSDSELVDCYLQGDKTAFGKLVGRHQQLVYNLCYRIAGPAEAEDLTQDIFIRLMDKVELWRGEAEFSTWLYKLALNQCRDHLRRKRPKITEVDETIADPNPGPQTTAESQEASEYIFAAMLGLSTDFRTIIFLRDIEGFSYAQIAELLDIEPGTVRSRLSRARSQLCDLLEPMRPAGRPSG
jgi:RNA polymerase sigma-70 factor (ECF subfamily)